MRAGPLRHRIRVEQNVPTKDALGSQTDAWTAWADVWAQVEPVSGREYMDSLAAKSEISTKFIIRHLEGLTNQMRIKWRNNAYHIAQVIPVRGRDRMMEVMAVADPLNAQ